MVSFNSIITLSFCVASVMAAQQNTTATDSTQLDDLTMSHKDNNLVQVNSIAECPPFKPRKKAAKDVTDLRIDDIKIIGGLGDSIMAGFAMMGVSPEEAMTPNSYNLALATEFRGNSYAMGGDTNAVTLPNFIKNYSPTLKGASILSHNASFCSAKTCGPPYSIYRPQDILNGAQSGAMAMNLQFELDYLIPSMKNISASTDFEKDWKMVTIQVGSNDQCASCNSTVMNEVSAEAYGKHIEAAIARIKKEVPKVVVNLLGVSKVSAIFPLSAGQAYCRPINGFILNQQECSCSGSPKDWAKMDKLSEGYNKQLERIAKKYKGKTGGTFAVMYSPALLDISTFPIDAFSNTDCFHPSLKGHQWTAKALWNQLFTKFGKKPTLLKFDENIKITCPTDDSRLPTFSY